MSSRSKSDKTGELFEWQEHLSDDQTVCRDLHHAWQYQMVERTKDGYLRQLQCRSCETFKIQFLDNQGFIVKSSYEYSEGYKRPAGAGRVTTEENARMRLLSIKRRG